MANTRETLTFSCLNGHTWVSMRFVGQMMPQTALCPKCGHLWTNVVADKPLDSFAIAKGLNTGN